jgi:hypothetical protein
MAAAVAATMATAVATVAMATAVAPIAVAAAVATIPMARPLAAVAAIATASSGHPAENKGRSLLLTAHQGDPNQGEKHRQPEHNNAVHPRILQLLTGTVSGYNPSCRPPQSHR